VTDGDSDVATYSYDGRNRRITQVTYADGGETREFYFTTSWQNVEERVDGAMVDQYVWGLRYIDELVCRDDASDTRYYVMQDANFNVTSICTAGSVVERYLYEPYGTQTVMNASWTVLSGSAYDWAVGFQGLMLDVATGSITAKGRLFHPGLGAFLERNPWGYIQGRMSLYDFCAANPITYVEPYSTAIAGTPTTAPAATQPTCTIWLVCDIVGLNGVAMDPHCGVVIDSPPDKPTRCDGSGGDTNQFSCASPGPNDPPNAPPSSLDSNPLTIPVAQCKCLRDQMTKWNACTFPRDHLINNSNWSLSNVFAKCGVDIPAWDAVRTPMNAGPAKLQPPPGVPNPPTGWNAPWNPKPPAANGLPGGLPPLGYPPAPPIFWGKGPAYPPPPSTRPTSGPTTGP
jgi:RHS repeat-associated protein